MTFKDFIRKYYSLAVLIEEVKTWSYWDAKSLKEMLEIEVDSNVGASMVESMEAAIVLLELCPEHREEANQAIIHMLVREWGLWYYG